MQIVETVAPEQESSNPVFHKVGENLYRHVPSGNYYALLKRGGKQFRRSLKTADRALAQRRLSALRDQVNNLTLTSERNANFADVAKAWTETQTHALKPSSLTRREVCISGLTPFFDGVAIRNVTHAHCQRWVEKRGSDLSSSSFVQELDTLRLILDYAVARGLILSNPAKEIKRRKLVKAKIVVPSREQFGRLISAMRDEDGSFGTQGKGRDAADLVELIAYSGARLAEGIALKWSDVDFQKDSLMLSGGEKGTKNHEVRTIPMTGALREFLTKLKQQRRPQAHDAISRILDAKKCLQTTCRKLQFPQFTHHDFRHFFATTCIESGVDIPTISRWLGHKDGGALAMKVYGHLREEHSFAMIKKVSFASAAPANGTTG